MIFKVICSLIQFYWFLANVKNVRGAWGIGLAYRILGNMAKIELNYCYPFKFGKDDRCQKGFQFGLGIDFL